MQNFSFSATQVAAIVAIIGIAMRKRLAILAAEGAFFIITKVEAMRRVRFSATAANQAKFGTYFRVLVTTNSSYFCALVTVRIAVAIVAVG